MYKEITPAELAVRIARGDELRLIDVREPIEYSIAHIEGSELCPLSSLSGWVSTLPTDTELVFICHHGVRSAQICTYLAQAGFHRLVNLVGGIDRWSREVDSSVPRY